MPVTEQLTTTIRHRKSGVVRKLESELQLLHTDHRKTAKQRWSTCFAFIFRRSKFKSTDHHFIPSTFYSSSASSSCTSYSSSSSSTSTTTISTNLPACNNENDNDNISPGKSSSEQPTYHLITTSLPPTPASSLSPPPRKHIMTRQCRTKSLTPLDYTFSTLPSTCTSPVNPPLQRRHYIPRPSVLRLSLDVDHRYSYTSSVCSSDSHGADLLDGSDNDNQSLSQETSSTLIERRRQRQQQQRCFSWIEEKTATWTSSKQQQTEGESDREEDDVYETWHSQISKDKAHYDAIVASTMHHRHSTKEQNHHSSLDTPPSSAPLSAPLYFVDID